MTLWARFTLLFRKARLESEMAEELRAHLELQIERNVAAGMSAAEARRAAHREFGGLDQIEERCRDAWGQRWWHDLSQDIHYALRLLRRQPGFAGMVTLTFALGIGATTAIFSVLNGVVLRPLAVHEPDRLAVVWETNAPRGVTQFSVSYPNYRDWRERSESWSELAAFDQRAVNFVSAGEPQRLTAEFQTANALAALGIDVALGRRFLPGEDEPGQPPLAILSDASRRRLFAADAAVIGESLWIDGRAHTVVGVLPPAAGVSPMVDVVLPLGPIIEPDRTDHGLNVVGRLRPAVTLAEAQAEMQLIARQLEAEHPEENAGWNVRLEPLLDLVVPPQLRRNLHLLLVAVGLLLLIACANVSGLLLVRATSRTRELAVRAALGGGRGRLMRQLVTEGLVLAFIGGAVGVVGASWIIEVFRTWEGLRLPRADAVALDGRVLAVAWAVSLASGILAGVLPALKASRLDLVAGLKEGLNPHLRRGSLRNGLIIGQLAIAVILLSAAGLVVRTVNHLRQVDLGFDADSVLTLRMAPPGDAQAFWHQLVERVQALPGVAAVGLTNGAPMGDMNTSLHVFAVGPARVGPTESVQAEWRVVNGTYFDAVRIPLLRGEVFREGAGLPPRAVIVNQTLARLLWGDEDPLGRQINPGGGTNYATVIGVVGDIRSRDPAVPPSPAYYLSTQRFVWGHMTLVVRTSDADPAQLLPLIRAEVRALDPTVPLFEVRTLEAMIHGRLGLKRLVAVLLASFALAALGLALIGLYGVMSFTTAQRTREAGIRLALGATASKVVRELVADGVRLVLAGLALGAAGAALLLPLMNQLELLVGVRPYDLPSAAAALSLLLLTSLVACYLPARRAAFVDPRRALSAE